MTTNMRRTRAIPASRAGFRPAIASAIFLARDLHASAQPFAADLLCDLLEPRRRGGNAGGRRLHRSRPPGRDPRRVRHRGLQTTEQNIGTLKLAWDVTPTARLSYSLGVMQLGLNIDPQSYLRNATTGLPVYNTANGRITMAGLNFPLSGLNPAHTEFLHLMQGLEYKTNQRPVRCRHRRSSYDQLRDVSVSALRYGVDTSGQRAKQRHGLEGGRLRGRIYRPTQDLFGRHEISFGGHFDHYALKLHLQRTRRPGGRRSICSNRRLLRQERELRALCPGVWKLHPGWTLTIGGRQEWWRAFDGFNENTRGTGTQQQERALSAFMPKASLAFQATPDLLLRGSWAMSRAFPA